VQVTTPAADALTEEQVALLISLDTQWWWQHFAKISLKGGGFEEQPTPNILQERVLAHYRDCQAEWDPYHIMIPKPRQKGASTIAEGVIYHHMRKYPELKGLIMGDVQATSDKVFEMFRTYAVNDAYPWPDQKGRVREEDNLTDEITLPNGSKFYKETAGSTNA